MNPPKKAHMQHWARHALDMLERADCTLPPGAGNDGSDTGAVSAPFAVGYAKAALRAALGIPNPHPGEGPK